jgi:hypothetical protein
VAVATLGCPSAPREPSAPTSAVASVAPATSAPPAASAVDATAPADAGAPSCDHHAWATALLPRCEPVGGAMRATATAGAGASGLAVDGDACTMWSAGAAPPQSITVDLGAERTFGHVILVAAMTPKGPVQHVVEVSDDGVAFDDRALYEDAMFEGGVYGITLTPPARARYLRVRTDASPSSVAWYEVVPVACPGETGVAPRSDAGVVPTAPPAHSNVCSDPRSGAMCL